MPDWKMLSTQKYGLELHLFHAGAVIYRKSFIFAGLITTAGFAAAVVLRIVFDFFVQSNFA